MIPQQQLMPTFSKHLRSRSNMCPKPTEGLTKPTFMVHLTVLDNLISQLTLSVPTRRRAKDGSEHDEGEMREGGKAKRGRGKCGRGGDHGRGMELWEGEG